MLDEYAPRGSDIYYVLRQISLKKRRAYQAIHALAMELNQISEQYREANIAEQKLRWWQDELERFFAGQASHPILYALNNQRDNLSHTSLLALVEANLLSLKTHIFETRSELMQHYQHLGGIQFDLKAQVLGLKTDPTLHHQLGTGSEILRHLIHFRRFLHKQHLYFALEDFRSHQIDPQPILQCRDPDTLRPLFEEYLQLAKHNQPPYQAECKPLFLELTLQFKQIQKIRAQAWQWAHQGVELTPLQKLFHTIWPSIKKR